MCDLDPPPVRPFSNEGNGAARAACLSVGGSQWALVCQAVRYVPQLSEDCNFTPISKKGDGNHLGAS
eukprot:10647939-Lingulodinium_polyedra.AAC.1